MKLRTVAVSLLALGLLAWFLRDANLAEVWDHMLRARVELVLLALVFVALTLWVRTVRWQYLLAPIGPTRFRTAFRATVIGFAALGLLPARAGDLLRPYLLARQEGLSATATFATIVMERVMDLIAVLVLLALYVWGFADASALPANLLRPIEISAGLAAAAAVVLSVLMWTLASHPERIGALVLTSGRMLPHRVASALAGFAHAFSGGFAVARQPRALLAAFAWSFPLWLAIAAEAWALTLAFGIAMPFAGSFLLQALLVIGVAVPTPGGVGSYHAMYQFGVTTFFGAPNDSAVAAAIVLHVLSVVPVALLGILFMVQDGLSVSRLGELAGTAREKEMPHTDEVPILRSSRG